MPCPTWASYMGQLLTVSTSNSALLSSPVWRQPSPPNQEKQSTLGSLAESTLGSLADAPPCPCYL